MDKEAIYTAKIFLNSAIPLLKVIIEETSLHKMFAKKTGIVQFSFPHEGDKWATHLVFDKGDISVKLGPSEDEPTVELAFNDIDHFNAFFKGTSMKLPQFRHVHHLNWVVPVVMGLLKMQKLLSASEPPADEETKALMVKLMFYLLPSGISQLNKAGHPEVAKWAKMSPDRVYALVVDGRDDLAGYIRVKAGKTRSARGAYKRSQPFFTMRFTDLDAALGVLLQTADMLALTAQKRLIMEGAPEFGAQIGDFMMLVGQYAQK